MPPKPTRILTVLFLAVLTLTNPRPLLAQAFAKSELTFENVTIIPALGTIEFLGSPWTATAFAHADNSMGESKDAYSTQSGGIALAAAHVTYADGAGGANAVNLRGLATTTVDIPVCDDVAASAIGRGSLANNFILTGGTGAVNVTFSADYFGELHVRTGPCGVSAITETTFAFDLFGLDAMGQLILTPILFDYDILAVFGPNQQLDRIIPRTRLSTTLSLLFTTYPMRPVVYGANIESDSESWGVTTVPEPSPVAVMLLGLGVLVWRGRNRDVQKA